MQIITDFIVRLADGQLRHISHRNNDEHRKLNGGYASLIAQGELNFRTVTNPTADINDIALVADFYLTPLYTATVVAKSIRHWDFNKPMGQRLIFQETSNNYKELHEKASKNTKF